MNYLKQAFQKPKGLQSGSKQNQMSEIDQFNMLPKSQDIEQNQHWIKISYTYGLKIHRNKVLT